MTLCSCGSNGASKQPREEFYTLPAPIVVSEIGQPTQEEDFSDTELGKQIKQDYQDYLHNIFVNSGNPNPMQVCIDDISIKVYFGNYNGSIPVMMKVDAKYDANDDEYVYYPSAMIMTLVVADATFRFYSIYDILVWKEGQFYWLNNAYDMNLLTQEDLREIADNHKSYFPDLYLYY